MFFREAAIAKYLYILGHKKIFRKVKKGHELS